LVDFGRGGKLSIMAVAMKPTVAGTCLGCGELVTPDEAFCPACGTRQAPDRPMPVTGMVDEAERLGRSTNAWFVAALVVGAVLLLVAGTLVGRLGATMTSDGSDAATETAAETMDTYAPIAEGWVEKHHHVADEASGDDPNGLATAAADARIWIDVNREDLGALAADADGGSVVLFQELVQVFDERSVVLADIEATATAGGVGSGAASDEMVALEVLDQQADTTTCEIAGVMRAEGDDPDDHITPEMHVGC
jgi:hypothetical protein